jgi:hypothetical protein
MLLNKIIIIITLGVDEIVVAINGTIIAALYGERFMLLSFSVSSNTTVFDTSVGHILHCVIFHPDFTD